MDAVTIALRVPTSKRLAELMRHPFFNLSALPEHEQQEVVYGENKFGVSVGHDPRNW